VTVGLHITPQEADEYAIGALEPDLEQSLRLHILGCRDCSELVEDAELVAARFALSAPLQKAPPSLRQSVMVGAGLRKPRLVSRLTSLFQAAAGIAAVSIAVAALAGMLMTRNQLQDLRRENNDLQVRIDDIDSAEVQIFAISERLSEAEQVAAELRKDSAIENELMAAMLSPSSQTADVLTIRGNSSLGRLIWEPDQSRVWFVAQRLPQLREGETYHLWLSSDGEYVSLGTFNSDESGAVTYRRFVSNGLSSYDSAVVTREISGAERRQGDAVFFVANLNAR
jgi:anti-sigma-K factor RskA